MNLRSILTTYIDVDNRVLEDSDGSAAGDLNFFRGDNVVFRCHLVDEDQNAYALAAGLNYYFGIDDNYTDGHADYVVATTSDFNDTDDWADADPTAGKICFSVDSGTTEMADAIGTAPYKKMYAGIWVQDTDGTWFILCHWQLIVNNVAVAPTGAMTTTPTITLASVDYVNNTFVPLTPADGNWRFKDGVFQLYNSDTEKYHPFYPSGTGTSMKGVWGTGEE